MGGRSTTGERKAEGGESSALASPAEEPLERMEPTGSGVEVNASRRAEASFAKRRSAVAERRDSEGKRVRVGILTGQH